MIYHHLHQRFHKRTRLKIILLLGSCLAVLAILVIVFEPLKIKNVQLINREAPCFQNSDLKPLVAGFKFWWDLNSEQLSNQINSKYPCVRLVQANWKFPNSLMISVQGRTALSQVANFKYQSKLDLAPSEATPSSQSASLNFSKLGTPVKPTYLIDRFGVVFGQTYENNLPVVYIANQNLSLGVQIPGDIFAKVESIVNNLQPYLGSKLNFDQMTNFEIKIIKDDIIVPTMPSLVFSSNKDISRQLASLQLILDTATINQRPIRYIDLRFGKPIIVYDSPKVSK